MIFITWADLLLHLRCDVTSTLFLRAMRYSLFCFFPSSPLLLLANHRSFFIIFFHFLYLMLSVPWHAFRERSNLMILNASIADSMEFYSKIKCCTFMHASSNIADSLWKFYFFDFVFSKIVGREKWIKFARNGTLLFE